MKKKHLFTGIALLALLFVETIQAVACDACKKLQPKPFQGITHGAGPDSNWDYVAVVVMIVVTIYVLVVTVRCMIRPKESDLGHIKRIILNDQ